MKGLNHLKAKAKVKARERAKNDAGRGHQASQEQAEPSPKQSPIQWFQAKELSDEQMQKWARKALEEDTSVDQANMESWEAPGTFPTNLSLENWLRSELSALEEDPNHRDLSPDPPPPPPPEEEVINDSPEESLEEAPKPALKLSTIAHMVRRFREQEPLPSSERRARLDRQNVDFHWVPQQPNQLCEGLQQNQDSREQPKETLSDTHKFDKPSTCIPETKKLQTDQFDDLDRRASLLLERCEKVLHGNGLGDSQPSFTHALVDDEDLNDTYESDQQVQPIETDMHQGGTKLALNEVNFTSDLNLSVDTAHQAILRLRQRFQAAGEGKSDPSPNMLSSPKQSMPRKDISINSPTNESSLNTSIDSTQDSAMGSPPPSYSPASFTEPNFDREVGVRSPRNDNQSFEKSSPKERAQSPQSKAFSDDEVALKSHYSPSPNSSGLQLAPKSLGDEEDPKKHGICPAVIGTGISSQRIEKHHSERCSPKERSQSSQAKALPNEEATLESQHSPSVSMQLQLSPKSSNGLEDPKEHEIAHTGEEQLSPLEESQSFDPVASAEALEVSDLTDPCEWSLSGSAFDQKSLPPRNPQRKLFSSSDSIDNLVSSTKSDQQHQIAEPFHKASEKRNKSKRRQSALSRKPMNQIHTSPPLTPEEANIILSLTTQTIRQLLFSSKSNDANHASEREERTFRNGKPANDYSRILTKEQSQEGNLFWNNPALDDCFAQDPVIKTLKERIKVLEMALEFKTKCKLKI